MYGAPVIVFIALLRRRFAAGHSLSSRLSLEG
jgi:hypothetical protein